MEREEVYKVIDSERDYQNNKWNPAEHRNHEVESYMMYMEHYLMKAREAVSTQKGTKGGLEELRKVVALGIACFEVHGVEKRNT